MNGKRIKELAKAALRPERYRWWHAAAFGVAANCASGLRIGRRQEDRRYYEEMEQASFAPPGWAFAPVWAVNNVSQLWGNLWLLNSRENTSNRRVLLALQGASWFLFSTFNHVYFRKRSPILGFAWTAADWLLTITSVALSLRNGRKDVALSLGTRLAWLTLATPVTAHQAAKNPDGLFRYDPKTARALSTTTRPGRRRRAVET